MFHIRSIVSHVLLLSKAQLPQIGLDRGIQPCGFLAMLPPCWESCAILSAKGSPSSSLRDAEEVRAFFRDLPTPTELQAMPIVGRSSMTGPSAWPTGTSAHSPA